MKERKKDDIAGGQALIEGVMMRQENRIASAVRAPSGDIIIQEENYTSLTKRYRLLGLMFIRGFVTLMEMMWVGMKALMFSAEIALSEEKKKPSRWELPLSLAMSILLVIVFFVAVPAYFFTLLKAHVGSILLLNFIEGVIRLTIFLLFLLSTLFMADMRRVFMYHGAEHKTVFAWEAGEELTVENVRRYPTRHPRCGTSFILIVMVVSILVFSLLGRPDFLTRVILKLTLLPLISGISYEIIRFTGRYQNWAWVKWLSWPGLWLQHITTREPTDDQIEVAIKAMRKVIN
ncbi:MAG: DUF1385 domain-containing protein [Syntrophales bacterium]|nr:DUF1385 domain-containing protein [Syntrophales bacterium]